MYDTIGKNSRRIYYDSMMLMALALNASIADLSRLQPPRRLEDFSYYDSVISDVFNHSIRHTEFTGISVSASCLSNGLVLLSLFD